MPVCHFSSLFDMAAMWIVAVLAVATVWGSPLDGPLEPMEFVDPMFLNMTVAPVNSTVGSASVSTVPSNVTGSVNSTSVSPNVTAVVSNGTTESPPRPTTVANSTAGFNVTESPIDENENVTMTIELENTTANSNSTENCVETSPSSEMVSTESDLTEAGNVTESATVDSFTVEGNFSVSEGVGNENATITLDPMESGNFSDVTLDPMESGNFSDVTITLDPMESGNFSDGTITLDPMESGNFSDVTITLDPMESGNFSDVTVETSTMESGSENGTVTGDLVVSTTEAVNDTETTRHGTYYPDEFTSEEEETTTTPINTTLPHNRWVHAPKTTTPQPDDSFKLDTPAIPAGKGLRICTWNVFRFGPTKFKEPDEFLSRYSKRKLNMMVEQVSSCDMLALQEFFDPTLDVLKRFARALSKNTGSTWNFTVSERVGRTSQEQYVFLFRQEVAQAVDQDACPDPDDVYSRDPFFTKFKILKKNTCFSEIVMGTIHTEPDKAVEEMNELVKSYAWAEKRFGTPNVMVAGDYNADCQYVRKSAWPDVELYTDKKFKWFIPTGVDTASMMSECTFDRAVVKAEGALAKCFAEMKVLDFVQKYKIKVSEARQLSDHFPVVLQFN